MNTCVKCGALFPNRFMFEGKIRNLSARRRCLNCSPFGSHDTSAVAADDKRLLPRSSIKQETEARTIASKTAPMRVSKIYLATLYAYELGYRVTEQGGVISHKGNVRALRKDTRGYYVFSVGYNKKIYPIRVHQLAAVQLFGNTLTSIIHVRHLDNNQANNSLNNFALGTPSQNALDIPRAIRVNRGASRAKVLRKLTDDAVKRIRNGTLRPCVAATLFGVSVMCIKLVRAGKTYKHVKPLKYSPYFKG